MLVKTNRYMKMHGETIKILNYIVSRLAPPPPNEKLWVRAPHSILCQFVIISSKRIISLCPAVVSPYCCVQQTSDISNTAQGLAEQIRTVTKTKPNVIQGTCIFSLQCYHGQTNTTDQNIYKKPAATIFRADSSRWQIHHV